MCSLGFAISSSYVEPYVDHKQESPYRSESVNAGPKTGLCLCPWAPSFGPRPRSAMRSFCSGHYAFMYTHYRPQTLYVCLLDRLLISPSTRPSIGQPSEGCHGTSVSSASLSTTRTSNWFLVCTSTGLGGLHSSRGSSLLDRNGTSAGTAHYDPGDGREIEEEIVPFPLGSEELLSLAKTNKFSRPEPDGVGVLSSSQI
ncbi:hypothetical protein ZHAS_00017646 [Anopheles sinensis]|uniref:Uncharacterized protein n=1 Tax=Anopheles sinensis TaxID=74873 RepID=A0A084WHD5_ANOSI|nr:hypothetical protein ZHAS_00017646 [Anopheles sinensis]